VGKGEYRTMKTLEFVRFIGLSLRSNQGGSYLVMGGGGIILTGKSENN
jgi:hypothetical protein